jgi:hypothetical protein
MAFECDLLDNVGTRAFLELAMTMSIYSIVIGVDLEAGSCWVQSLLTLMHVVCFELNLNPVPRREAEASVSRLWWIVEYSRAKR